MNGPEPLPHDLAGPLASAPDRLGVFGSRIRWYGDVPSTNDVAARLAEDGAPEGTIVAAHSQSAGRGRLGRRWISPPGAGLYVSAVLRPPSAALPLLTIAAGVAVAGGIEAASGLQVTLKWPNDVYAGPRKLAGILTEANTAATADAGSRVSPASRVSPVSPVSFVIVGFGINVLTAAYPPDLAPRATSLEAELGRAPDRGLLLAECLSALALRYDELRRGASPGLVAAWHARAAGTLGRRVQFEAAGSVGEGVACGIDPEGALIVRTGAGDVRVLSGEVVWL